MKLGGIAKVKHPLDLKKVINSVKNTSAKKRKKFILYTLGGLALIIVLLFVVSLKDLPTSAKLASLHAADSTKILDRNGKLLYETGEQKRTVIDQKDMPANLRNAVVSAEDANFFKHNGIDFKGIGRAVLSDIFNFSTSQGGSTITQQFVKNSEWYSSMTFAEILALCGKVTVSQVLEREDFKQRIENRFDVGIHEVMYPIMQGYDSVVLKADVEIGGDDQLLNMLMGRDLQRKLGQEPQDIIACPLLVGTDGSKKMSKSLGNYIGLNDSADEMFGKTMSIPDSALKQYLELAGEFTDDELSSLYDKLDSGENPKLIKEVLAINIIDQYHPVGSGERAKQNFDKIFVNREVPENIPEIDLSWEKNDIISILVELGFSSSRSEALRIVEQGGVSINSAKVESVNQEVKKGDVIKAGKRRFAKVL